MRNLAKNVAKSVLFAISILVITGLVVYPLIMALLGGDDFDGIWLQLVIEGVQLAVIIFIGKMIYDKISESDKQK